jgi:hypothetical protein
MPEFHPSTVDAINELRTRCPDVPFLTLGQTVLWDEPVKAAFCRLLEALAPEALIVAGVHDTDYFAKLSHLETGDTEKFVMLPHNDGATRDLWSAAGELSCLFGSETVPTRASLGENGVAFDRVARGYPGGGEALLNNETEAWGWRALVHTEPRPLIAADVRLRDIMPALRTQLEWGFQESLRILGTSENETTTALLKWVNEYAQSNPNSSLSDLYRSLTPRLWGLVRGSGSCNLQTTASLELFRFNRATAQLPRFRFVDLFLQPATRDTARRCYDDAVRGSGIYTLSQFGDGALPFDVVIPGRGRGTLRLHEGSLYIETEEPITLCTGCDCGSVQELADVLEAKFGPDVALVGKAVALISMLSSEYIFVFHEHASGYTTRTQAMNTAMRANGLTLDLHPMLRLKYATWDALQDVDATFRLPSHLAHAFGAEQITAGDFATRWEAVCNEQDALRLALKNCHSPRDLMAFLATRDESWNEHLNEYSQAREEIRSLRERTRVLEAEITTLRDEARRLQEQASSVERAKGEDWRQTVQPLRQRLFDLKESAAQRVLENAGKKLSKEERAAQAQLETAEEQETAGLRERIAWCIKERAHFDEEIGAARGRAHELSTQARNKTQERVILEKSEAARNAREIIAHLEYEAEWQRFQLVRAALLTSRGLHHTNYRPTAWWFPLISPDGKWLDRLANTARARIEEL